MLRSTDFMHVRKIAVWTIGATFFIAGVVLAMHRLTHTARGYATTTSVVLIVLDTFRADRLAAYGNTQHVTPFLNQWAAHSTVYEHAYAASAWTVPSIASLMLAQYPSEHQVIKFSSLPDRAHTLVTALHDQGFRTGGFSANLSIDARHGFDQGFDTFELLLHPNITHGDAAQINQAALGWVAQQTGGERPLFAYLQYMDTHAPYPQYPGLTAPRTNEPLASDQALNQRVVSGSVAAAMGSHEPWHFEGKEVRRLLDLYDGTARYLDRKVGELLHALEQRGWLDHAIIIITADHGEQFGEHGLFNHGVSLYESGIHVPLIVRFPGQTTGRRIAPPVEMAGLAPALLRYLAIPAPSDFHIAPLPFGQAVTGDESDARVFSELIKTSPGDFRLHRYALIEGTRKLLVTEDGQYLSDDLGADPSEDNFRTDATLDQPLREHLSALTGRLVGTAHPGPPVSLDDTARERLHSLGYVD